MILHCCRKHPHGQLRGAALRQYWRCLSQKLRRHLSGGLYHRVSLCDLRSVRIHAARHRENQDKGQYPDEQGPQQGDGPQGDALQKAHILDDGYESSENDYFRNLFNMLVLVGCIKMSDRLIRELMGL